MLGIKTFLNKKIDLEFQNILKSNFIPTNKTSFLKKKIIEKSIIKKLQHESWDKQIQAPVALYTHPFFKNILKKILPFNPNNLGNWSREKPFNISGLLEKKAINQIINLIAKKESDLGGYMTSGGTEANIFLMWAGKNHLKKNLKTKQLIVIQTGLTHYSITKAADITDIDHTQTSISSRTWGMDPMSFERTVKKEYKKGKRGFLIPLTLGYTITGSDDPIKEIDLTIKKLKKELDKVYFFCWVDAAFSGTIKPFIENNFHPFSYKNIFGFITDFHKFPSFSYPSGIVIYRKSIIKNIAKKVSYIERNDTTVLGSRSGSAAIATWYGLNLIGKNGFKKMINKSLKEKNEFINTLKNRLPEIKIITQKNSVQMAIFSANKKEKIILKKMDLKPITQKIILDEKPQNITIYKLYFLPFYKK